MKDDTDRQNTEGAFFVGVAASAGGLEAASLLVQNLPKAANAIYILAQHMSPTHKSLLTSLISRETTLPVVELLDPITPQPDTIYITPPNKDVVIEGKTLLLREPDGHSATPKPSADRLFKSMAAACGERCVAIVLSGTGSDGSYGVKAVREVGGITIAQEVATAKYDGMPASAVETGCVDLSLTPEQMGQHLKRILASPRDLDGLKTINSAPTRLSELMQVLLARTQVDFRDYKENTINRRISRRMVALGIDDYDTYVDFCRSSEIEVHALRQDLLISVTRFFRDTDQFQQLATVVQETASNEEHGQYRAWVAGCATGEEAYSIGILIAEALGGVDKLRKNNVQIFASDIDERALEVGRKGQYPISAAADIPKEYLDKYFEVSGSTIQVIPALRSVILFSKHNLSQDPPFINVDLVSLRNVLIYFNSKLQDRALRRVHYALNPGGTLFLGTSETVGSMHAYFENRRGMEKVFQKRKSAAQSTLSFAESHSGYAPRGARGMLPKETPQQVMSDTHMFDALARAVAPNGFIATKAAEIVRIFGNISSVIELSEGGALNLSTRILLPGMRDEASSMVGVVLKAEESRTGRWHALPQVKDKRARLTAYPILGLVDGEDHVLFAVEIEETQTSLPSIDALTDEERLKYVREIEQDMMSTREALQQSVEELQTSNEELQSVNEELQSTNEELQATNEELETSNEELQSTNEELITVNEEMQVNSAELQRVTSELSTIVKEAPYPILVVDQSLLIRRVSTQAARFFGLDELPVSGLHVSQCRLPEGFPKFASMCSEVLRMRQPTRLQVESNGRAYTLIVTPFESSTDAILGLSITVMDLEIDALRRTTDIFDSVPGLGHWSFDLVTRQRYWSPGFRKINGLKEDDPIPSLDDSLETLFPHDSKRLQTHIEQALENGTAFDAEVMLTRFDKQQIPVRLVARAARDSHGSVSHLVGAIQDLSQETNSKMLLSQFESIQDMLDIGFYSIDVANNLPFWSKNLYHMLGYDPENHTPTVESAIEMFHPDDRERVVGLLETAMSSGQSYDYEARLLNNDGATVPCQGHGTVLKRRDGSTSHVYGFFRLLNTTSA